MRRIPMCTHCFRRNHSFQASSFSVVLSPTSSLQPPLGAIPCTHLRGRSHSRWFALYEDFNRLEHNWSSEVPSSSIPSEVQRPSTPSRRSASACAFIPTLADPSELGGRDTVDEEAAIAAFLTAGEGTSAGTPLYDLDALLASVEEANLELPGHEGSRALLDEVVALPPMQPRVIETSHPRNLLPASSSRDVLPESPARSPTRRSDSSTSTSSRSSTNNAARMRGARMRSSLLHALTMSSTNGAKRTGVRTRQRGTAGVATSAAVASSSALAVVSPAVEERQTTVTESAAASSSRLSVAETLVEEEDAEWERRMAVAEMQREMDTGKEQMGEEWREMLEIAPVPIMKREAIGVEKAREVVEEEEEKERPFFAPSPSRSGHVNERTLMQAVWKKDLPLAMIHLSVSHWPSTPLHYGDSAALLGLVVRDAPTMDDVWNVLRDYAMASTRHSLPDECTLSLAARAVKEEGIGAAERTLQMASHTFMLRSPTMSSRRRECRAAARQLWKNVFEYPSSSLPSAEAVYSAAARSNLVRGPRDFVREAMMKAASDDIPFDELLSTWSSLGRKYGCEGEGMDIVVEKALGDDTHAGKRIGALSSCVTASPSFHIESLLVHVIVSLLKEGRDAEATHVAQLISIPGRHYASALRQLQEDKCNLAVVERLSVVLSDCLFAETKKGGRKKDGKKYGWATEVAESDPKGKEEEMELDSGPKDPRLAALESMVWAACGVGPDGKKRRRKGGNQPMKAAKKKMKMDQVQVHEVATTMQKAWESLAREQDSADDKTSSLSRLAAWSAKHRLAIPAHLATLARDPTPTPSNAATNSKRESGV